MASKKQKVEVAGIELEVDEGFMGSWEAFKLLRAFNDDSLGTFEKLDLSFELIEAATGVTEEQVVEAAGGPKAPAVDVVNTSIAIVKAISPKN